MGLRKVNWKLWKGSTILDAIKNIHLWSMRRGQNVNVNRNLEEIDSNPHGWLWGETSVKEVTADVVEIATELEWEEEPEDVIELGHLMTNLELMGSCFLWMSKEWFLETEQADGEDAVKIAERTTKNWDYYMSLVGKTAAGFEGTDSNSERISTVGKMLSNNITCYKESSHGRQGPLMWQPSESTSLLSQQPSTSWQDPPPAKRWWLTEGPDDG